VQVDKSWCKCQTLRVNGFRGELVDVTDGGDPPVLNADVAAPSGCAGTVDDVGVADKQV
jgi:hypothetical protein